jgi:hypothetical protein
MPADPNGLAVAPDLGRVYAGLADGSVAVIDTRAGASTENTVIQKVATGAASADLLDYSAAIHRVFAAAGGSVYSLDAVTGKVMGAYKIGYNLEQPRYDPSNGMLYVTSPDVSTLFQIDPATGAIKNRIALGLCDPKGLAVNSKANLAVVVCRVTVVSVNLGNPSSVTTFLQVRGGDIASYDEAADRYLIAAPTVGGTMGVGVLGGNPIAYKTLVPTDAAGASAVYDEANHVVYTPDVRAGRAGLIGFAIPSGEVLPAVTVPWSSLALVGGLLAAFFLVFFMVGRKADPINRPAPITRRRRA